MRALPGLFLMTLGAFSGAAFAEAPVATTATYGNWTLGCQAQGEVKTCQVVTRLNVKGQDGQVRPLLSLALGKTEAGFALRVELPGGVDLRKAPVVRAAPQGEVEGAELSAFQWLTCDAGACLAEVMAGPDLVKALAGAKAVEMGFTLWQGGKTVRVPVSLDGFGDALAALKAE